MVTTNIVRRIFRIKSTEEGTCFTIDVDNRQYIVTAQHIVKNITHQDTVKIMQEEKWKNLQVKLVGHGKGDVDISVLAANLQISPTHPLPATSDGIILGQDAYFLGFPYGLMSNIEAVNRNFPLPLVKKATVSMVAERGNHILLDGHNNPGFSGGPVIFKKNNHGKNFIVAGVVCGYQFAREPVYENEEQEQKESPMGYYKSNTGIIIAYNIEHALSLIRKNPIGVKLETNSTQN